MWLCRIFVNFYLDSLMSNQKPPIILGIEGTAHTAGIAIIQGKKILLNKTITYTPSQGGIHPREASEFLGKMFPELLKEVKSELSFNFGMLEAIAFSQGPGLGPCLRTTATVARSLALLLNIPLIGVNHCIAHIELGRSLLETYDPLVLYVSGGNTQLITFLNDKYRVLGETLDIAIGNALDSLGRELGLPHPGGPQIEKLALKGKKILNLPYVIKGMSFSFSGIVTAAKRYIKSHSISDICYSFQEFTFSALAEATERAIACTKKSSILLTGGVAANQRLQDMIKEVAKEQGVAYFVVPRNLSGDNGAMIALAGLNMFQEKDFITIDQSRVKPRWRTDQVDVSWIHS